MLTLDHRARLAAAVTILRAHTDAELDRILPSCTAEVAADCRDYVKRYGRPEPFGVPHRHRHDERIFSTGEGRS